MPVADKTFLDDPELVLIRPLPTTNAIGGRENFNLWAGNEIGHKVGLIIGSSPKSDGPRRSVTVAELTNYVRSNFGNTYPGAMTPDEVTHLRPPEEPD